MEVQLSIANRVPTISKHGTYWLRDFQGHFMYNFDHMHDADTRSMMNCMHACLYMLVQCLLDCTNTFSIN